jgi:endonuclease G
MSTLAHADPLVNCLHGCPGGAPAANQLVDRDIYTLSNNPVTKFADWVAYKVDPGNFENASSRSRNCPSSYKMEQLSVLINRGSGSFFG